MADIVMNKGYMIKVTTWENDGDYYLTSVMEGLTIEEVRFWKELSLHFMGRHYAQSVPGAEGYSNYGNEEINESDLEELVGSVIDNHPCKEPMRAALVDDAYAVVCEILEYPKEYDGFFCRVVERFEVYDIKETVVFKDVSQEVL